MLQVDVTYDIKGALDAGFGTFLGYTDNDTYCKPTKNGSQTNCKVDSEGDANVDSDASASLNLNIEKKFHAKGSPGLPVVVGDVIDAPL